MLGRSDGRGKAEKEESQKWFEENTNKPVFSPDPPGAVGTTEKGCTMG